MRAECEAASATGAWRVECGSTPSCLALSRHLKLRRLLSVAGRGAGQRGSRTSRARPSRARDGSSDSIIPRRARQPRRLVASVPRCHLMSSVASTRPPVRWCWSARARSQRTQKSVVPVQITWQSSRPRDPGHGTSSSTTPSGVMARRVFRAIRVLRAPQSDEP